MKKHSFKEWLIATRPWSFPASAMPVLVTLTYLYWLQNDINWINGIWALVNIVIFHAAGNTWSDYFDFKRGVDTKDTYGVKTLTGGMFTPKEIYRLSLGLLAVALIAGVGLWVCTGFPLLYIGIGGAACALLYPPLKYHALGDVVIFLAYAFLPTLGTSYVTIGVFNWDVLWVAIPVGLITVAILHANNTRDIQTDSHADIRTLAMKLGGKMSMYVYCAEILFPFGWIAGCAVTGTFPLWTLLVAVVLIPAIGNVRMVSQLPRKGEAAIANLDEMTAKLQLLFSLIFALSFVIAALLA